MEREPSFCSKPLQKINFEFNSLSCRMIAVAAIGSAALSLATASSAEATLGLRQLDAVPLQQTQPQTQPQTQAKVINVDNVERDQFSGQFAPVNSEPSGFLVGSVTNNSKVKPVILSDSKDWVYVQTINAKPGSASVCGWVEQKILARPAKETDLNPSNPCLALWGRLKDRSFFASHVNCAPENDSGPESCVDGEPTKLVDSKECNRIIYGDFASGEFGFNNITFPLSTGGFDKKIRWIGQNETIYYRYLSLDKKAAAVRVKEKNGRGGWGFVQAGCINKEPLPEGGAEKTNQTVPGPNPNNEKKENKPKTSKA